LNGTIKLFVGSSATPSWNLINNTGAKLTSLTVYYSGALASNASIDMQISGTTLFKACTETDATNTTYTDSNCGTGDIAPAAVSLPLKMVWSGGDGIAVNGLFNLGTASFAHANLDAGCISGTTGANGCGPISTPEPSGLPLLVMGLLGVAVYNRRLRRLILQPAKQ